MFFIFKFYTLLRNYSAVGACRVVKPQTRLELH